MTTSPSDSTDAALVTTTTALLPGTRLPFQFEETETRRRVEEALYRDEPLVFARTSSGESGDTLPNIATRTEVLDAMRSGPEHLTVVAAGIERVRIIADSAEEDIRVAWQAVEESQSKDRALESRAGDVLGVLARLGDTGVELADSVREDLETATPSKVADVVGSVAFEDPAEHQKLLEEPDVLERLARVEAQLDRLLQTGSQG